MTEKTLTDLHAQLAEALAVARKAEGEVARLRAAFDAEHAEELGEAAKWKTRAAELNAELRDAILVATIEGEKVSLPGVTVQMRQALVCQEHEELRQWAVEYAPQLLVPSQAKEAQGDIVSVLRQYARYLLVLDTDAAIVRALSKDAQERLDTKTGEKSLYLPLDGAPTRNVRVPAALTRTPVPAISEAALRSWHEEQRWKEGQETGKE